MPPKSPFAFTQGFFPPPTIDRLQRPRPMVSYFRNVFSKGNGSSSKASGTTTDQPKSRSTKTDKASGSVPVPSPLTSSSNYNIYAASPLVGHLPGIPPSSSSDSGRDRKDSHGRASTPTAPNTSSPLRYHTYNSDSVRSRYSESIHAPSIAPSSNGVQPHPYQQQQKHPRIPIYRTASNTPGDRQRMYLLHLS